MTDQPAQDPSRRPRAEGETEIDPVADLLADWQDRRDRGEHVTLDDLVREHPDLADVLRARVAAIGALAKELTTGAAAPARERLASLRVDRYVRFRPAGAGGMGLVYWALDTDLNREVAFKVIRPDVGGPRGAATPTEPLHLTPPGKDTPASSAFETLKRRFLQEAWVTAGLEHPGIVPVYELGQTPEGVPYYTMRFVRGSRTLAGAIDAVEGRGIEDRIPLLEPFLKVCDAIRYAHAKGVIHRDLKPDNVALGEFGEAVVLDWGLAKLSGAEDRTGEAWKTKVREMRESSDLRTLASALGTPGYMSPEAALGRMDEVDARSDVYSLGAILYQILVGRLPFTFESYGDLVRQLMAGSPADPTAIDPAVPADLSRICLQALAKNRDARQPSVDVLASDIRSWLTRRETDREVEALAREARTAIDGARDLAAADRLRQLDRAGAALERIRELRPADAGAAALTSEVDDLRRRGVEERELAARRRTARRAGAAALAVAAVAGVAVAVVIDAKRRETEDARAATAAALVAEKRARDAAETESRRSRALALVQASSQHVGTDPMLALLLARESVAVHDTPEASDALRAAIAASLERVQLTMPGGMRVAAVARDAGTCAIGSDDGAVGVWDAGGRAIGSVPGGGRGVSALDLAPDGRVVAIGRVDGTVELRAADGALVATSPGRGSQIASLRFGPGGDRILVTDVGGPAPGGTVRCTRLLDGGGRELAAIADARLVPVGTAFSRDGSRALVGFRDGTVVLWDAEGRETGRFRAVADGDATTVVRARISPDGDRIALLLSDASVRVVGTDGAPVFTVPSAGDNAGVDVVFAPAGGRLVVNDWTHVRVFDERGEPSGTITPPSERRSVSNVVRAMAVSPDGTRIATATDDDVIRLWSLDGRELAALRGHAAHVRLLAFSADGRRVTSFAATDGLKIWDPAGGEAAVLSGHAGAVVASRFSPDGARVVTSSADRTARVWTADGTCTSVLRGHEGPVVEALWTGAGGRIVTASRDGTARVWEADGRTVAVLRGHGRPITSIAVAAGGRRIATSAEDGTVRLWDADGTSVAELRGGSRSVASVAFSPDGALLVTGGLDYTTRLWDAATGTSRGVLAGGHTGVAVVAPDGAYLAGAFGVEDAAVWKLDGTPVGTLTGHRLWIAAVAFSPDARRVVTASYDGTARIWDLDGTSVAVLGAHHGAVTSAVYSPDGALVATTSDDGTARLWDASGEPRAVLPGHVGRVRDAAFSPDGRRLVTSSDDGTARIWLVADADVRELSGTRATRGWRRGEIDRLHGILGPAAVRRAEAFRLADRALSAEVLVADAIAALESDATLPEDLRRDAVADLRGRRDDWGAVNAAAWRVVCRSERDPAADARALRWAEAAARIEPESWGVLNTLGAAHVRAGDPKTGLEWLDRSLEVTRGVPYDVPSDAAFRALALAALGRVDEADAALRRAIDAASAPGAALQMAPVVAEATKAVDAARAAQPR